MTKQKCKNKMAAIIKKHAKEDTAKSHLENKMAAQGDNKLNFLKK